MTIPEISAVDARQWLASTDAPRLVDVREQEEWDICHLDGAELIPLSRFSEAFEQKLEDREAKLLIYCHHGVRSAHVTHFLQQQGFTGAVNLAGGIDAWSVDVDPAIRRY